MVARGMHYAVTSEHEAEMLRRAGDQNALVDYLNILWDEECDDWQYDTDKIWAELHLALGDGKLDYALAEPLHGIVLGGRLLSTEDWFIVVYKTADEVRTIATAMEQLEEDDFRARYSVNVDEFDVLAGCEDTLHVFREVRNFYRRAAGAARAVIFAVDQ